MGYSRGRRLKNQGELEAYRQLITDEKNGIAGTSAQRGNFPFSLAVGEQGELLQINGCLPPTEDSNQEET